MTSVMIDDSSETVKPTLVLAGGGGRGKECVVPDCDSRMYQNEVPGNGVRKSDHHFFKFPQQEPERSMWCNRIKRVEGKDNFNVTKHTVICERHFTSSDLKKTLTGRFLLVKGVHPSVFPERRREAPLKRCTKASKGAYFMTDGDEAISCITLKEDIVNENNEFIQASFINKLFKVHWN